ncbi:MAG TPA: hypothetical protein VHL58_04015 [Thermoanaerobaculia bacterium]|nr:hypothetical protein [Thermoanaerobaculia bacterium]
MIAQLRWQKMFQALASGDSTDGVWLFKLQGFLFRQFVAVHRLGEPEPEAIFNASPSFNGVLEIKGGRSYYWDSNFWLTKWIWTDVEGAEIMHAQRHLTIRMEGSLSIPHEFLSNEDLPLLALLGWYMIQIVSDLRIG